MFIDSFRSQAEGRLITAGVTQNSSAPSISPACFTQHATELVKNDVAVMLQTWTNLLGMWKAKFAQRATKVLCDSFIMNRRNQPLLHLSCCHLDVERLGNCLSPEVDREVECPIYYPLSSSSTSSANCLTSCVKWVQMDSLCLLAVLLLCFALSLASIGTCSQCDSPCSVAAATL